MAELADNLPPFLERPVRLMVAAKEAFVAVACVVMALTFFCVVILRYGFQADLFAYEEWLLIICFWLYFMGSALGTYEGSHINGDLLTHLTEDARLLWARKVVVNVIELGISLAIVYWSVLMVVDEAGSYPSWQTTIALKIPFLVPRIGVLLGFVLMTFYTALHLFVLFRLGPQQGLAPRAAGR